MTTSATTPAPLPGIKLGRVHPETERPPAGRWVLAVFRDVEGDFWSPAVYDGSHRQRGGWRHTYLRRPLPEGLAVVAWAEVEIS